MRGSVYSIEFADLEGLFSHAGIVVFDSGVFEGGYFGYHYSGVYDVQDGTRFRADGWIARFGARAQPLGAFDFGESECRIILAGRVRRGQIEGRAFRVNGPPLIVSFRLIPRGT